MEQQKVIISQNICQALDEAVAACSHDLVVLLADRTTLDMCYRLLRDCASVGDADLIAIGCTDSNKTLFTLTWVWKKLQRYGATRHSLLVNLGGGMVTDLGGFAASTFKRGIPFINIPTTLLAMVDASVGGKTGINFEGLKNEIGVFNNAECVILDTVFLRTLDRENILSGYAEMLKHGLISTRERWATLVNLDPTAEHITSAMVADNVSVKQRIVAEDPTEHGLRKALNFGHTVGHAFESLALERQPILHGYAVAYGLIAELYLSCVKVGFPTDTMRQTVAFIKEHYGRMPITCDDYPRLIELMHHDKKNVGNEVNFTLLADIGDIRINQTTTEDEIKEALDFYREC